MLNAREEESDSSRYPCPRPEHDMNHDDFETSEIERWKIDRSVVCR